MIFPTLLMAAAVWLVACMAGAWVLQWVTRNCGWVDAVWSGATGLGGAACALVPPPDAHGVHPRAWVAAAMAAFWGVRLAWHIARRTRGSAEDARYAQFRREWGAGFEVRLFGLLMVQAAAAWVLVAAVVLAARNPAEGLRVADGLGALVLIAAVCGEAISDAQLRRFRAAHSGGVCDTGLWAWSRHPNYFFEFMAWCGYPLLAIDISGAYPVGILSIAGPGMMFFLLRYVSGVPPLEAAMLERRGEAFRAYQARVSVFFPRAPKRGRPGGAS